MPCVETGRTAIPVPGRENAWVLEGDVSIETTDGTVQGLEPGDLVLLEDVSPKGHVTRNIGDGYATFLAVPVSAV